MSKKKVLVIGGTGIAGQFITDYLLHYHDICELFIASRGIHKISEKKVKFIKMDIHDTQNIESVIKQSDYPFMHLLYSQLLVCQRVCLQNTVCLICK